MAGINNEKIAKALGMDEKSYRVLEEPDGKWFAMDAGERFRVVDEQRTRQSWSLGQTTEMMGSEFNSNVDSDMKSPEVNEPTEADLSKAKNYSRSQTIFTAEDIVVRRIK